MKRVIVRKRCSCGGEFKYNGMCLTSLPAKYVHECNSCKKTTNVTANQYPYEYFKFEPEEEIEEWVDE